MKLLLGLGFVAVAAASSAQSVSSFRAYTFSGLSTTLMPSGEYTVSLAPGATVSDPINGSRVIRDIFAFYIGADTGSFATSSSLSSPTKWSFDKKPTLIGWEDKGKKQVLSPGGSFSFRPSFTLTTGTSTFLGYHVRVAGAAGTTFFARPASAAPVPEPASMAVLGLGLAALKRRRKNG